MKVKRPTRHPIAVSSPPPAAQSLHVHLTQLGQGTTPANSPMDITASVESIPISTTSVRTTTPKRKGYQTTSAGSPLRVVAGRVGKTRKEAGRGGERGGSKTHAKRHGADRHSPTSPPSATSSSSSSHPRPHHRATTNHPSPTLATATRRHLALFNTLLTAAAAGQSPTITSLLSDPSHALDPDTQDPAGRTALHFASAAGHADTVHALLAHGADTTVQDVNGNTPLHLAVVSNHLDAVLVLLRANANPAATDARHRTPVQLVQARLGLMTGRAQSETAGELIGELRKLVEILRIVTASGGGGAGGAVSAGAPSPQASMSHPTLLDPRLLAMRLAGVTTSEEVVDVVDDLRGLLDSLELD